jgi:multicomponent K+:H+ antiporter subunit A
MLGLLSAIPFLGAALFFILSRYPLPNTLPRNLALAVTTIALAVLAWLTFAAPPGAGEFFVPWIPALGLDFSLWLDGPAKFYAWLVLGIGWLVFFYAGHYMDPDDSPWRFYGTMVFFMGSMLGVVLSRNALLMFCFWELTSISSFILIGHWHEKASAREGAVRALVVTGSGGLAMLAGLAGLYWISQSSGLDMARAMEWDVIWERRDLFAAHWATPAILVLLLVGAFTKSAQFPFHFWLPGAMEAPTPVSAFLHAATMVKAGIYLLGRLYPAFSDSTLWLALVGTAGVATMLVGGAMALVSRDLKQLLAHSTVSQLGLLTAYYGFGKGMVGTEEPLAVDLLLVLSHALFKGALFMIVGIIDHGCHTREWTRLGGLRRAMPVTFALTVIGCASMAGLPLTLGFVAKELFLHAGFYLKTESVLLRVGLPAVAIVASFLTMAYSLRMAISPFFGKPRDPEIHAHEGGPGILFAPALLLLIVLAGGLYVPLIDRPISALINAPYYATTSGFTIAFFPHVDKLLVTALVIFAMGVLIFRVAERVLYAYERAGSPAIFRDGYNVLFNAFIPALSAWQTRLVQTPSLARNLTVSLAVVVALAVGAMRASGFVLHPATDPMPIPGVLEWTLLLLTALSIGVVMFGRSSYIRVVGLAPVGVFVIFTFVLFKAPDLALTQIMVEVAVLLVLLLVLSRLPQRPAKESGGVGLALMRPVIAVAAGLVMAALTWTSYHSSLRTTPTFAGEPAVSQYYLQNSKYPPFATREEAMAAGYPGAESLRSGGGNNVVNVTLVDYRGIDTFGEITVLGLAGLGVLSLLALGTRARPNSAERRRREEEVTALSSEGPSIVRGPLFGSPSLILSESARVAPAFMLILAIVLFFAGHNLPGGGFIAGLMTSVALVTAMVSLPRGDVMGLHRSDFTLLIPLGLLIALIPGVVSVVLGLPFLTTGFGYFNLPLLGKTELASAMVFDLGVFLTVVGTVMVIAQWMAKE